MKSGRESPNRVEASIHMRELKERLSEDVLEDLLTVPDVRPDVVARARRLLDSQRWCRAEEVAAELVDCFIAQRVP